jgi:argininosuccinate lyase
MKLWSGRFTSKSDRLTEDFNASITVDSRMYRQDIKGSIAHAVSGPAGYYQSAGKRIDS